MADFYFNDKVKDNAERVVSQLQQSTLSCHMLTGDSSNAGKELAEQLALDSYQTACTPKMKLQAVEKWSQQGEVIAMVGDGINDSPVFNSAHLSVAMDTGADISKNTADVVLLNSDLNAILSLRQVAQQTRRIVKQNLTISLLYNASILPLAALG